MIEFEFLNFDWSADLLKFWRDSKEYEKHEFFCMIFLLFLLDFSANISNKSFIVKYDLRCDFWCWCWCLWIDDCGELDEDVKNMNVKKQMRCAFVIKINKCDDVVDANLNMKIIDEMSETTADLKRRCRGIKCRFWISQRI